jgi:uncharacterized protein involved in type VI secretion and phage assembly
MTFDPAGADRQHSLADASGRFYGVVVGTVTDNNDKDGKLGRVKVKLPWLAADAESEWARVPTAMGGKDRGFFYLPEPEDEVLLGFEHGNPERPYVLGVLYNGKDAPPAANDNGENNLRFLKSRSGLVVRFDDKKGDEKIEIADKDSKNSIVIEMAKKKITITSNGDIAITAADGKVSIEGKTVEVTGKDSIDVKASSGTVTVEGKTTNVKGSSAVNIN